MTSHVFLVGSSFSLSPLFFSSYALHHTHLMRAGVGVFVRPSNLALKSTADRGQSVKVRAGPTRFLIVSVPRRRRCRRRYLF